MQDNRFIHSDTIAINRKHNAAINIGILSRRELTFAKYIYAEYCGDSKLSITFLGDNSATLDGNGFFQYSEIFTDKDPVGRRANFTLDTLFNSLDLKVKKETRCPFRWVSATTILVDISGIYDANPN